MRTGVLVMVLVAAAAAWGGEVVPVAAPGIAVVISLPYIALKAGLV